MAGTIRYRADIDGLRAVAVVPVVLFHAGIAALSGGYVGVDVFFVISGYLITQTLLADIDRGRFSIIAFYERRIRRIYPALFAMLLVAFVASAFLLSSFDQQRFAKAMAATVLFSSNIVFFREAGYFDAAAELKPLLHTWSLAVEEQFYIAFPLLLALVMKWRRGSRNALLVAITLGSLALSIYATPRWPSFNFYLPFTRAWELLAGALLAVGAIPAPRRATIREGLAGLGLALILAAILLYRPTTPFPGLAALPPVLGAALLIHAGEGTAVGRALTWRPVVYIGLISYSLYLWHWPVIVFTRFATLEASGPAITLFTIALSFALGSLSMHTVERYFRQRGRFGRRAIFVGGVAGSVAMLGLAGVAFATHGLAFRNPAASRLVAATAGELDRLNRSPCLKLAGDPPRDGECVLGAAVAPSIALLGDSSGAQLAASLDGLAKARGIAIWQLTKAGCPPIVAARFVPVNALRRDCPDFVRRATEAILAAPSIRTVVIAGRWDALAADLYRAADAGGEPTLAEAQALASRKLAETAAAIRATGRQVIVLGPIPLPPRDPFVCYRTALFTAKFTGREASACGGYPAAQEAARRGRVMAAILDGVARAGVPIVQTRDLFCDAATCRTADARGPLYMDDVHLTRAAAGMVNVRLLDGVSRVSAGRAAPRAGNSMERYGTPGVADDQHEDAR